MCISLITLVLPVSSSRPHFSIVLSVFLSLGTYLLCRSNTTWLVAVSSATIPAPPSWSPTSFSVSITWAQPLLVYWLWNSKRVRQIYVCLICVCFHINSTYLKGKNIYLCFVITLIHDTICDYCSICTHDIGLLSFFTFTVMISSPTWPYDTFTLRLLLWAILFLSNSSQMWNTINQMTSIPYGGVSTGVASVWALNDTHIG